LERALYNGSKCWVAVHGAEGSKRRLGGTLKNDLAAAHATAVNAEGRFSLEHQPAVPQIAADILVAVEGNRRVAEKGILHGTEADLGCSIGVIGVRDFWSFRVGRRLGALPLNEFGTERFDLRRELVAVLSGGLCLSPALLQRFVLAGPLGPEVFLRLLLLLGKVLPLLPEGFQLAKSGFALVCQDSSLLAQALDFSLERCLLLVELLLDGLGLRLLLTQSLFGLARLDALNFLVLAAQRIPLGLPLAVCLLVLRGGLGLGRGHLGARLLQLAEAKLFRLALVSQLFHSGSTGFQSRREAAYVSLAGF
jgi:hypothetical protein